MRLICLNVWEGILWFKLKEFIERERANADVFCFQEVFHAPQGPAGFQSKKLDLYNALQELLPDFQGSFAPTMAGMTHASAAELPGVEKGLTTFVRRDLRTAEYSTAFVYRSYNDRTVGDAATNPRLVHTVSLETPNGLTHVCNFHGLWWPGGKTDNPARLEQSKNVRAVLDLVGGRTVLCGDFNLNPDTESLRILERGMVNLIAQHGITSTRSSYYERAKYSTYADYVLVTPDIKVEHFSVLPDEVSDHLPLSLEFA